MHLQGVVSLLDEPHCTMVEDIWREFKERFDISGIQSRPFPHYSYHVAPDYDLERLEDTLREVASQTSPLTVRTTGLGIFTGPNPALYIATVRSPRLSALQQVLWKKIVPIASESNAYYHPNSWIPHITLAYGDITHEHLPRLVQFLGQREFEWEIEIDNLALIYDRESGEGVRYRFPLGG